MPQSMHLHALLTVGLIVLLCGCESSSIPPRQQALSLARDDIACSVTEDCCAVVDGCRASVLLVSAADYDEAADLLARASQDGCVFCSLPSVQVDCRQGRCIAVEVEAGGTGHLPLGFYQSHCGALQIPDGAQERSASSPISSGLLMAATVIGCGE